MLNIVFNGIKPNEYKFEYSIQGNNKVDYICFSFNGGMPSGKPFLKIESKDKSYIDKIDLSEMVEGEHIHFPLLAKTTAHKVIKAQLQFETEDTCYQTEIVEIMLKNTIKADEEIENNYPSALSELERFVARAKKHDSKNKNFVIMQPHFRDDPNFSIDFLEDVQLLTTSNSSRRSKNSRGNFYGTKYGNRQTSINFAKGSYDVYEIINRLFQTDFGVGEYNTFGDMTGEVDFVDFKCDIAQENNCVLVKLCNDFSSMEQSLTNGFGFQVGIRLRTLMNKHKHKIAQIHKLQVKFVKDFEKVFTQDTNYWKGTMAKQWLEIFVFVFINGTENTKYRLGFYARPRRF